MKLAAQPLLWLSTENGRDGARPSIAPRIAWRATLVVAKNKYSHDGESLQHSRH
jgi:hypothetical protein